MCKRQPWSYLFLLPFVVSSRGGRFTAPCTALFLHAGSAGFAGCDVLHRLGRLACSCNTWTCMQHHARLLLLATQTEMRGR